MLERLAEAHLPQLDVAYHMLRAIQRLAKGIAAPRPAAPQSRPASAARLIDLLLLMAPPRTDPPPEEALLLVRPTGGASTWAGAARDALTAKKHRFELARCWRALLALPLSDALYHRALRALPAAVLPHVARPLQFCDLLSDGYARGGVDALLSLKGLFVLMQKHNLEYPRFSSLPSSSSRCDDSVWGCLGAMESSDAITQGERERSRSLLILRGTLSLPVDRSYT